MKFLIIKDETRKLQINWLESVDFASTYHQDGMVIMYREYTNAIKAQGYFVANFIVNNVLEQLATNAGYRLSTHSKIFTIKESSGVPQTMEDMKIHLALIENCAINAWYKEEEESRAKEKALEDNNDSEESAFSDYAYDKPDVSLQDVEDYENELKEEKERIAQEERDSKEDAEYIDSLYSINKSK